MPSKRHGCTCEKCRECCEREPGWFVPKELSAAAKFLKLTDAEFIERFCEEHYEDGICAISPAQKPGKKGCVFLGRDGLCAIHPVKPYECRKVYGCEGEARHRRVREIIKRMWK